MNTLVTFEELADPVPNSCALEALSAAPSGVSLIPREQVLIHLILIFSSSRFATESRWLSDS